jgi:hypothetical protein
VVPVEVIVVLELATAVVIVEATEAADVAVPLADVLGTAGVQPGRVKVPS